MTRSGPGPESELTPAGIGATVGALDATATGALVVDAGGVCVGAAVVGAGEGDGS